VDDRSTARTRFEQHDAALIARIPEAEPAVFSWRARFDPAASFGVPAHVTVLYPFMPRWMIDGTVLDALTGVFASWEPFESEFAQVEQLPGVIWLRTEPNRAFRALTGAVWKRWPEYPPYEGRFDDLIPHLTIAAGDGEAAKEIMTSVTAHLPIRSRVAIVELITFENDSWETRATFPLARG